MAERALVDTDILSEVIKGKDRRVVDRAAAYLATWGRLTTSVITVMEVVSGLQRAGRHEQLARFQDHLVDLEVLHFALPAALLAGQVHGDLVKTGQPMGRADPMIAAMAITQGFTLVTGNTDHYARVQQLGYGLRLDNWR
jgi:predicted nucleic acid-binding protein